jgi:hypothetical protein
VLDGRMEALAQKRKIFWEMSGLDLGLTHAAPTVKDSVIAALQQDWDA